MDSAEACRLAGLLLLQAGFQLRHSSLKSEARYYGWPGRRGLLRVAAHAGRGEIIEGEPVLANLTFASRTPRHQLRQSLVLTRDQLEAASCAAIGRFMIASAALPVSDPAPDRAAPPA